MPSAELFASADAGSPAVSSLKPFSITLSKAKPPPSATKSINPRKRPHSSLAEDESENEDTIPEAQLVSAFDHSAGGAIGINEHQQKKGPLVIPGQKNQDWREESYRRKVRYFLPAEAQAAQTEAGRQDVTADKDEMSPRFGLTFAKVKEQDTNGDVAMVDPYSADKAAIQLKKPQNVDDEAMEALLGNGVKKSTLVLPMASTDNERKDAWTQRRNEDDDFRFDVASRPDSASLEDYAAVPVEEFGAAMLRGMNWKEPEAGEDRNDQLTKPRELLRRPALLGIGAKNTPDGVEELGASRKAAKGKRKVENTYNPLLLKNSVTGETITEEELKKRKQNQKVEEEDWRERRDKNLALDAEKKGRRRHGNIEDSRRSSHSRHDRSRSPERSRHSSSCRTRSISAERNRHKSSRTERSRSGERNRYGSTRRDKSSSPYRSHNSSPRRHRSRSNKRIRSTRDNYDDDDNHEWDVTDKRQRDKFDGREEYRSAKTRHRDRARNSDEKDKYRRSKY